METPIRGAPPLFRRKFLRADVKVLDSKEALIEAVVSTEDEDREKDIIRTQGWDLDNFLKHPVLLSSHEYHRLRAQIGEWVEMKVVGKQLIGTAQYFILSGNDEADWAFLLATRNQAAFSVGFIPDFSKAKELPGDGFWPSHEFNGQELLEVSQVTVPANPYAVQAAKALWDHPDMQQLLAECGGTDDECLQDVLKDITKRTSASPIVSPPPMYTKDFYRATILEALQEVLTNA
jgi:hypothetical protein